MELKTRIEQAIGEIRGVAPEITHRDVASKLNEMGIPSLSGEPWTRDAARNFYRRHMGESPNGGTTFTRHDGAVNQYWLHYRLLEDWGYTKLAKKERAESIEEMQHADKIVARIIFLEGHPNLQSVAPLRIGQNVKEVLESDLAGEYDARTSYKKSREICAEVGDYVTMHLFEELLADEEGHIDFLETQLGLLETIGEEKYGLLNAAPANEAE